MKQTAKTSDELNPEKQRDIQHALQQMKPAGRRFEVPTLRRSWRSTLIYAVLILALGGAYYPAHSRFFVTGTTYKAYGERLVRYLVLPKQAGQIKTVLTRKMLEKLNEEPKRVLFPAA